MGLADKLANRSVEIHVRQADTAFVDLGHTLRYSLKSFPVIEHCNDRPESVSLKKGGFTAGVLAGHGEAPMNNGDKRKPQKPVSCFRLDEESASEDEK